MASPQTEDGCVRIANELWDAIVNIRIPGEARQVLDAIIRKTYGWNKTEDNISLGQFSKMTGQTRIHVLRSREKLLKMNIIAVTHKGNTSVPSYRLNKDYETWRVLPKKGTTTHKGNRVLPIKVIGVLPIKVPTKDKETKDTIQKTKKRPVNISEIDKRLVQLLIDKMLENNLDSHTIANLTEKRQHDWMTACRLMREKDNRTPEQIEALIKFSQNDNFWKGNILSFPKLREKQDQLIMAYQRTAPSQTGLAKWYRIQEEKYGKKE
ncbi:MAG: replication protein [Proteobacteria bacterium]|nr:replication protein [Pseudomonadota bacterium]